MKIPPWLWALLGGGALLAMAGGGSSATSSGLGGLDMDLPGGGGWGSDDEYIQWLYDNIEIVDVQDKAATVNYKSGNWGGAGQNKRDFNSPRPLSDIFGICLHQVAVDNVGDSAWPKVTAHIGVSEDGKVYRIHPYDTWLAASHGFNDGTVSIEVGGLWKEGEELGEVQVHALRRAILLILDDLADEGIDAGIIVTHRQTHSSRRNDSGRTIWQQGALWARDALGAVLDPEYSFGSGAPIPDTWMVPGPAIGARAGLTPAQTLNLYVPELDYDAPGGGATPPVAAERLARRARQGGRDFDPTQLRAPV